MENKIYCCILSLLKSLHMVPESNWFKSSPREYGANLWIENLFGAPMWHHSTVSMICRSTVPYTIYSIIFFFSSSPLEPQQQRYSLLLQFCVLQIFYLFWLFAFERTAQMFVIHFSLILTYIIQQLFTVYLTCQQIVISMCLHSPTFVQSVASSFSVFCTSFIVFF